MGFLACLWIGLTASLLGSVGGHGRLSDPPCRASMWRFGWDTPPDYTDNQLFCGGKDHEEDLGGKCGICGDPYDEPEPRTHEIGGPYYMGYLVQNYTAGTVVTVTVNITANHRGYFQFKICPVQGFDTEATQECLDNGILEVAGTGSTDYYVTNEVKAYYVDVQLPDDLDCQHCVFQWRYHCGNTWGTCDNGTEAMGCGPQEEFYGCADVSVRPPPAREWLEPFQLPLDKLNAEEEKSRS